MAARSLEKVIHKPSTLSWNSLKLGLNLPEIAIPKPTHQHLVCNLILTGYMPDHLDFISYFASQSGYKMGLPSHTIHLPSETKKWHVNKGPFVHAKTKEVFERQTHHRLIQVFDSNLKDVDVWVNYVNKNLPPGIDLKVTKWEWRPIGFGKDIQVTEMETFESKVLSIANHYLEKFKKPANKSK